MLKQLDGPDLAKVNKALDSYARDLQPGETPLLLTDTSFLQNGSSGLLLTDRCVYASDPGRAVPLDELLAAAVERPTALQRALAVSFGPLHRLFGGERIRDRLVVNGLPACEGKTSFGFWAEALTALGRAARRQGASPDTARRMREPKRLSRLVAAAVAARQSDADIRAEFAAAGAAADEVERRLGPMREIAGRRDASVGVAAAAVGIGIAGLGGVVTAISGGQVIAFGAMVCGVLLFGVGAARLAEGPPPVKAEALFDAWAAEHGPD